MISLLGELLNQQSHKHQPGTSAHTATAAATPLVTAVTPSPVPDHGLSSQDMDESGHEIDMSDIPLSGITQSEHNQHSSECDGSALKHPPVPAQRWLWVVKGKDRVAGIRQANILSMTVPHPPNWREEVQSVHWKAISATYAKSDQRYLHD